MNPYNPMNNKPTQLESMNKESQDKLYSRQPQLMKKLIPLINRANIFIPNDVHVKINLKTNFRQEPFKSKTLVKSKSKKQTLKDLMEREKIRKINLQRNNLRGQKINHTNIKKISEISPKILWGLK